MSVKERRRVEILSRVRDGVLSLRLAAEQMGVSERQAWRLKHRYAKDQDAGLVHGLRGRVSNNRSAAAKRSAILKLYREKYAGFGPTLACEYLAKDGQEVSHDALGRWLRSEGLFEKRRHRGRHRLRRPRRERAGELVQMDGSWHDWFEGRRGWCCLMVMIDDATGRVTARFYERETQSAAFDLFGRYVRARGLPRALYVDKAGIYRSEEGSVPTQFGRAMKALDIELILANSPQAKGRVERMNGTLQDRLVKALGLARAGDIASGNALLEGSFLEALNGRFGVRAAKPKDAHRVMGRALRLEEILCEREERAVGRDWCVQWRGRLLQIDPKHVALDLPRAGRRVTVIALSGGDLRVRYEGKEMEWRELSGRAEGVKAKKPKKPVKNNKPYKPGPNHPFNRSPACPGSLPRVRPSGA